MEEYPDLVKATGYGTGEGLCGWNCRHNFHPFWPGISVRNYTDEQLAAMNEPNREYNGKKYTEYELSQKRRALERRVRAAKRRVIIEKAAGLDTGRAATQLAGAQKALNEFVRETGGKVDAGRTMWTVPPDSDILEKRNAVRILPADTPEVAALKERLTEQARQLPAELQEALRQYTGFTGTRINNAIGQNRITPAIQRQIELLDRALADGQMPERTVLYRRTSSSFLGIGLPKEPSAELLRALQGVGITNNIFTSTSFRDLHLPGRNTLVELTVPKGYEGCLYLPSMAYPKFKNQDEVLFARGLRYKVMEIRFENGEYTIKAEVQP